jgi:hypothetical protein
VVCNHARLIAESDFGSGAHNLEPVGYRFHMQFLAARGLVKSFGGDLVYESREHGCCFNAVLERVSRAEEAVNA